MVLSKNKKYQYLFFSILCVYTIFNGGNSNILIQLNFILISLLFLYCLKDKNYILHFKIFYLKNRISIFFYTLFLFYLVFQIIPLPIEYLKLFSPFKYDHISELSTNIQYSSISLSPSNSFFQILNFISLLILVFILKMIFYTNKHKNRLFFFLTFIGAFASCVAVYFYLIGNPDFWIIKNINKSAATGFFISRAVFSCFLTMCFFSGIEYLKMIDRYRKNDADVFFNKIYIRIFLLFITIGIITSFSKIGNFLFISLITLYILQTFYINDKKNKFFLFLLLLIILFDVLILGFYFGSEKLINRYSFLQNDIYEYLPYSTDNNFSRGTIVKFALSASKKFILFGYGGGGFENLFKINFNILSTNYASHAHSDIVEFIGEFGLIGFILIILSLLSLFSKKKFFSFKNFLLCYLLIFILIFDFSLHVPIIQLLFVLLISISYERSDNI